MTMDGNSDKDEPAHSALAEVSVQVGLMTAKGRLAARGLMGALELHAAYFPRELLGNLAQATVDAVMEARDRGEQGEVNIERALGDSRWIAVEDGLPQSDERVLVYRPTAHLPPASDPNISIKEFRDGRFDGAHAVTHWQPLVPPGGRR